MSMLMTRRLTMICYPRERAPVPHISPNLAKISKYPEGMRCHPAFETTYCTNLYMPFNYTQSGQSLACIYAGNHNCT